MNTQHTVTVHTRDHGDVTVPEPSWCLGEHGPQNGGYRADIVHDGPEVPLVFRGFALLHAGLVAHPCAERMPRGTYACVDVGADHVGLDPEGLQELAAGLIDHAATLRNLARELAALLEEEVTGQ